MKTSLKTRAALWLAMLWLLAAPLAHAGLVDIAQVPLLNIAGTGSVKPNLMMVYDNSGSMDFEFTPDVIAWQSNAASKICRSASALSTSRRTCDYGDPPFTSADFNKQYYNPRLRYTMPVKADGSSFSPATYGIASPWSNVWKDGFDSSAGTTNLVTGFPDLRWCDSNGSNCEKNTATYTYPIDSRNQANAFNANPYYYSILSAEYCTDATMTNCTTTAVGAAAPANFPVAAKVRWCSATSLATETCQAKTDASHIYPRFSGVSSNVVSYGTITFGASATSISLKVNSVTVNEAGTPVVISNGVVTAASGTVSTANRALLANNVAASISAKAGLTNQYLACVRTPTVAGVASCASWGITLPSDYVVAVIPLQCLAGATNKTTQCDALSNGSRSGWTIAVSVSSAPPTALVRVSGTSNSNFTLAGLSLGGVPLFDSALATGTGNKSSSTIAAAMINQVNAKIGSTVKAYAAGNNITPACDNESNASMLCLVDSASAVNGVTPTAGATTNRGSITFSMTAGAGADTIPVTTAALSAGNAIFVRTDIVSGATFTKFPDRSDCTGSTCTYTEEMNNFATWYAFYRSRNAMMKTAVGQAFAGVSDNYRVGLALLRETSGSGGIAMTPATFSGTNRSNWYTKLYAATASGGTPLRNAVHKVGLMFANTPGVVTELCQPNFMLVTTDGYWNGAQAADVVDNDNVENASRFCTRAQGCVDSISPNPGSNSLADVALYWYNGGSNGTTKSLTPALNENMAKEGKVPGREGENKHLHINTYTLGLGVDGIMTYDPNYDNSKNIGGDFSKILAGATGCPWNNGGKYTWPNVQSSDTTTDHQSRVDDLWHAAVNGRGKYFSASVPEEVVKGVTAALNNMQSVVGAAAAAATSTPNISQQDNDIFSDTYTTVKWYGELSAQKIDINTGEVGTSSTWNSSATLGLKVSAASDTRAIYMLDTGSQTLKPFRYSDMSGLEKGWFDNRCSIMSQCTVLSAEEKVLANNGENVVNWLRGHQQYANDNIFRAYSSYQAAGGTAVPIVLGDIVSSKPAYLRDPRKSYTLPGYAAYKKKHTQGTVGARKPMVFTAANDGMLHAFDASNGQEQWAYAPRITMQKLAAQASLGYATNHQFTTDGSPELGDVEIGGEWRTVLVAGLGGGGRGFYALDVTIPESPKVLWELCADPAICSNSNANIGLTFGNAQFGKWNGKWVVFLTSGYNNVPGVDGVAGGDGKGYLFIVNVATGVIERAVSTGSGSTGTPSGLAKITSISANPQTDPLTTYIYGGDNQGQMWRFDLTDVAGHTVTKILMGNAGPLQPVTTRPDVSTCTVNVTGGDGRVSQQVRRVVLFGTGRLLAVSDTTSTDTQSLYLLKDLDGPLGNPIASLRGATMVKQTLNAGPAGPTTTYTVSNNLVDLTVKNGWYIDWALNPGERMNLDPKIINGGVNVVTNVPGESSACSVGGTSNVYQVGLCTGSMPSASMIAGSTLSGNSAAVGFIIVRLPSGKLKMISTLADGKKVTTEVTPFNTLGARKVGWRRVTN